VPREAQKTSAAKCRSFRTKLQEAKMWAGKVLEAVGNPFPAELADKAEPSAYLQGSRIKEFSPPIISFQHLLAHQRSQG